MLFVQWSKEEDPTFQQEGEFLVLPGVSAGHSGLFTCTATNVIGRLLFLFLPKLYKPALKGNVQGRI